ncbi:MAG: hypothetical protein AB8B85_07365 [Paracoccaceae bacterium]
MKRVLLVAGADHTGRDRAAAARVQQVSHLLQGMNCVVDLLSADPGTDDQCTTPDWPEGVAHVGVAPIDPRMLSQPENTQPLASLIAGMVRAPGYDAVFMCRTSLPEHVLPGIPRAFDVADGRVAAWPTRSPELHLAADEALRQVSAGGAARSARWPLAVPAMRVSSSADGPIGWPGDVDGDLARAWGQLASDLGQSGAKLEQGLMLNSNVHVPRSMSRMRIDPVDYSLAAQMRAIALGVLPISDIAGHLPMIIELVGRGVPVLTTPPVADRFEGRWNLPVADDMGGMAGWIDGWVHGRDVDALRHAAAKTANNLRQDALAMDAFVRGLVTEMLGLT